MDSVACCTKKDDDVERLCVPEVRVYAGADGAFELYEDDGESAPAAASSSVTTFTYDHTARSLTIRPGQRSCTFLPKMRIGPSLCYRIGIAV